MKLAEFVAGLLYCDEEGLLDVPQEVEEVLLETPTSTMLKDDDMQRALCVNFVQQPAAAAAPAGAAADAGASKSASGGGALDGGRPSGGRKASSAGGGKSAPSGGKASPAGGKSAPSGGKSAPPSNTPAVRSLTNAPPGYEQASEPNGVLTRNYIFTYVTLLPCSGCTCLSASRHSHPASPPPRITTTTTTTAQGAG